MAFKLVIAKQAELDIDDSVVWYENRQHKLGDKFYNDLISTIDYLKLNPYLFPSKDGFFREAKFNKFPYVVIYEIENDTVIINAVFNTSKNPGKKPSKF